MDTTEALDAEAGRLFSEFLRRLHLLAPSDLTSLVAEQAGVLGATDVAVRLIDYEQTRLVPLRGAGSDDLTTVPVEGTVQGRAFTSSAILQVPASAPDRRRVLVPLLDGTERLGTLELTLEAADGDVPDRLLGLCERYAHLVAQSVVTKGAYGDVVELTRRTEAMDVSAELIWRLMPPLVFASDDLVLAGLLEPCYASGGDCLDYAVNGRTAHLAIFDAMGHGLAASGLSSFAVSAYRSARRRGLGLAETYAEMDAAIARQAPHQHVTSVLAELDLDTGSLRWVNAGHPPPLVLREGKVVKVLDVEPRTPLGMSFETDPATVTEETLQRGDMVLLYTDGLPEARLPDGEFFGLDRLAEFIERQAASGYPAPETLRRLRHAVVAHQHGRLQDDASALLVEWRRGSEAAAVPPTV